MKSIITEYGFDGYDIDLEGTSVILDAGDNNFKSPTTAKINNLITALETPGEGSANQARLSNDLAVANMNLDNALDNVLTVRAGVGARLKEVEALNSAGEDKDLQYARSLADLQDLDYTKAISNFTMQQTILTAAQQSFVKTTGLSLFNFL